MCQSFCNFQREIWPNKTKTFDWETNTQLLLNMTWNELYTPGCISGGANGAVANNHNVVFTTELQKFRLCKIRMTFNLQVHAIKELIHMMVEWSIKYNITEYTSQNLHSVQGWRMMNDSKQNLAVYILQTHVNLWFSEISQSHLVGHRFVFEAGFIQQKFQLPSVEVRDPEGLHQAGIFASLQGL